MVLQLLRAKSSFRKKMTDKQRRKLLALDGEQDEKPRELFLWRDHPVGKVRSIAQKPKASRKPQELEVLCDVLGNVSIFRKVNKAGLHSLAAETQLRVLQPGEILCEQGEHGNVMWIIVQGCLEAWQDGRPAPLNYTARSEPQPQNAVDDRGSLPAPARAPQKLSRPLTRAATMSSTDMQYALRSRDFGSMVNVATPTAPGYSGELALLNSSSTRSCTMRAGVPDNPSSLQHSECETVLLEITREQFTSTAAKIVQQQTEEKMASLRKCATLNGLEDGQLSKLLYYMEKITFPAHTTVARKGEPMTSLYIVTSGECKCLDDSLGRQQQPTSAPHAYKTGGTAAETGKTHTGNRSAHNAILRNPGAGSARKHKVKNDSQRVPPTLQPPAAASSTPRAPRRVEIAKLGPGQLIGDVATPCNQPLCPCHSPYTLQSFDNETPELAMHFTVVSIRRLSRWGRSKWWVACRVLVTNGACGSTHTSQSVLWCLVQPACIASLCVSLCGRVSLRYNTCMVRSRLAMQSSRRISRGGFWTAIMRSLGKWCTMLR